MSILSLPRHYTKRHGPAEAVIPVATHLSARGDRDRVVGFADVADFDPEADFTGMPHGWQPARGGDQLDHDATLTAVAELRQLVDELDHTPLPRNHDGLRRAFDPYGLPRGFQLQPVDVARVAARTAGIDENVAAILAAVAAVPFVRHEDALHMALAPIAAMLDKPDSWPPIAYDLARSVTVSDELAKRPTPGRLDLRDLDGYLAVAAHENAIASIQMDIYADRAARLTGVVL